MKRKISMYQMKASSWVVLIESCLIVVGVLFLAYSYRAAAPLVARDPAGTSTAPQLSGKKVFVYFMNNNLDPAVSCLEVFPVVRTVEDSPSAMRKALEALLAGPTAEEKAQGYTSAINPNTHIQSLMSDQGDVVVDFDSAFASPGGGSCRVSSIRAEIDATIHQFPGIHHITITANGEPNVLEP